MRKLFFCCLLLSFVSPVFAMYTPEQVEQIKGLSWAVDMDDYVMFNNEVHRLEKIGVPVDVTPILTKILAKAPTSSWLGWLETGCVGVSGGYGAECLINKKTASVDQSLVSGGIAGLWLLSALIMEKIRRSRNADYALCAAMMRKIYLSNIFTFNNSPNDSEVIIELAGYEE